MLVATVWTLLFCLSERMSCTLTLQSILSRTRANVFSSFTISTARSRKWCPMFSWILYFMGGTIEIPYLLNFSTSYMRWNRNGNYIKPNFHNMVPYSYCLEGYASQYVPKERTMGKRLGARYKMMRGSSSIQF